MHKSLTFGGEPQFSLQYRWCSVNYKKTKGKNIPLKETSQKCLLTLQKASIAFTWMQYTANMPLFLKIYLLCGLGDPDHLLCEEEFSETIWQLNSFKLLLEVLKLAVVSARSDWYTWLQSLYLQLMRRNKQMPVWVDFSNSVPRREFSLLFYINTYGSLRETGSSFFHLSHQKGRHWNKNY